METDVRQKQSIPPTSRRPPTDPAGRTSGDAAGAVLRLQGAAGNAAVSALIGRRRLARDRKLPADPTSLADYSALAGEISFDTAGNSPVADVADLFKPKGGRINPRDGFDVAYHFSKDIAAESDKQSVIETGLMNIARALFNLASSSTKAVKTGTTSILNFDLARFGGRDGRYRFTSVAGNKSNQVEILIEYLGAAPAPLNSWDALGPKGQKKLAERFARFGFTWGDGDVGWSYDKQAQVMQALALIPDAVLNEVSGISWERGRASAGPDGEGGEYTGGRERKVVLYTSAFADDYGLIELVAHELGHGLGYRPQERRPSDKTHQDEPEFRKAAGPLAKAPTEYGRKAWKEDFAEAFALFIEEPDTLKLLRPDMFAYFTKLVAGLPAPATTGPP
jgi:hypothetical protein